MNEFIAQFIVESRDLVEQATTGLAALEQSPHDAQWMDATFRAVHTLKGGAAIVDFSAMERLVHAAEDALGELRAGKRPLDKAMVAACLATLDQVLSWLDEMERTGEVPAHADTQVSALSARLTQAEHSQLDAASQRAWLNEFLKRNPSARNQGKCAVRFTPHSANFFQGEDPLGLMAALPKLLAFELEPIAGLPALETFDPFDSILMLTAATAATADEVRAHFANHSGDIEIVALDADEHWATIALPDAVRAVLQEQIALLDNLESASLLGRVGSAGLVAANLLRYCKQNDTADLIARATEQSLSTRDPQPLRDRIARALQTASAAPVEAAEAVAAAEPKTAHWVRTLRVDAERVDALVRLTGELTVVKNAIGHAVKLVQGDTASAMNPLKDHHATLDRLISELQRAVLSVRVLPLRTVMQRFPRLVREISASLNKQVSLVIEGDDTEADKLIVEMLFEPLLHVLRNALDHGIERAEIRAQHNKPPVATIRMRAARQGGQVHIQVEDDGSGINIARVRNRARQRGVVDAERLDAMSDAELIELVFAPGFSTADEVTGLSGRGVGMDAVRTAVERIGGRVSMESREAQGASVRFTLPFSVMMTHVLTVEVNEQMFGIPLDGVVETLSVPSERLQDVGASKVIVRRDRTIPIFDLASLLSMPEANIEQTDAAIVVASVGGHLGGIRVDRLGERMEVMLKPLDGLLASLPGISGTSILGDGRVLLVLDLAEVLQ